MTIQLHFLEANIALTKTFSLDKGNNIMKEPYPMVKNFISHIETISTMTEFHDAVVRHAALGHCLLKGKLDRSLNNESRAGHTISSDETNWVVFDVDGFPYTPEEFMKVIGYSDIDYFVQYSASAGVIRAEDNGIVNSSLNRYHIFAMLDKARKPDELKSWLKHLNLTKSELRDELELTATNMSLSWPLDITVCQNDKLIYISAPECGKGVLDTIAQKRITQVSSGVSAIPSLNIKSQSLFQLNQSLEVQQINEKRRRCGLPDKQSKLTTCKGVEVLANPDSAKVTGIRNDRGFVYLNLNGGDSWAYYHSETNADVIYNFKNEPNYRTEKLDPSYYQLAKPRAKEAQKKSKSKIARASTQHYISALKITFQELKQSNGKFYCMFRDRQADTYFVGHHDFSDNTNHFDKVGSKDAGFDYLLQHGCSEPDPVLTWDYQYKPDNKKLIDLDEDFVNKFQPSKYMLNAKVQPGLSVPKNIHRLIDSALGSDQEMVEHFINWLAVIFKHRRRTQSAWVLQGTTGTGKGALFHSIIKPLIGADNCRLVTLQSFEENYNAFAEHCLVLFVDEVDTDQIKQQQKLMAKLKSWITELSLPLRVMRVDLREVDNYLNIIMASNQPNSMRVESNDRRMNVCPRQEKKLLKKNENGDTLIKNIETELAVFANYLQSYQCDLSRARTPIENEAKRELQATTQTAIEEVAHALNTGDLQFFIDYEPTGFTTTTCNDHIFDGQILDITRSYRCIVNDALECIDEQQKHLLQHESLFVLFVYLVGKVPATKAKLTSLLRHNGINIKPQTYDGVSVRGVKIAWQPIVKRSNNVVDNDVEPVVTPTLNASSGSNLQDLITQSKEFQAAQDFKNNN
jgi:Family of unknown function (DUF5906)